jgi:formylglycine-generating enzyme required for sulfatase activity
MKKLKLLRGGSYAENPIDRRSAYRYCDIPQFFDLHIGFRVVKEKAKP